MADKKTNLRQLLDQAGQVFAQGRLDEAGDLLSRAIGLDPLCAEAHHNLGLVHTRRQDWPAAIECFTQASSLSPGNPGVLNNLAKAYFCSRKYDLAMMNFARAIAIDEKSVGACRGMGQTLAAMGDFEKAVEYLRRALAESPDNIETLSSLGESLGRLGRRAEETAIFEKVVSLRSDYAEGYNNLGNSLYCAGHIRRAEECYAKAISLKADLAEAKFNLALLQLLEGRFAEGWANLETRYYLPDIACMKPEIPRWDGRDLSGGTLLVMHEQGFGDSIHFVRYLKLARRRCGRLVFGCPKELQSLFADIGADELVENYSGVKYDAVTGLLSLPGLFRADLAGMPADIPYLRAEAGKANEFRRRMPTDKFNVGLAWSGHPTYARNHERAMHLWDYGPVLETPGLALHSLQVGGRADEIADCPDLQIHDWSGELKNFSDTAALVEALDLVITTDTAVAHLAGAMGKPVWLLLALVPDWRWLLDRSDCPWYPTMRLFRQKSYGDWAPVATSVAGELKKIKSKSSDSTDNAVNATMLNKRLELDAIGFPPPASGEKPTIADDLAGLSIRDLLAKGGAAFQTRNFNEAKRCYDRILGMDPRNYDAMFNIGVLFHVTEQFPQAACFYQRAVGINPKSPLAQCNLGYVMVRMGRFEDAVSAYAAFAEIEPNNLVAQESLAGALLQAKNFERAADAFGRALAIKQDQPNDWFNLGLCMENLGRFDRAEESFRKAISIQGGFALAMNALAGLLERTGRLEESVDYYQKALAIDPNMIHACWGLGHALLELDRLQEAEKLFRRAVELAPENAEASWNLAQFLLLTGNFEEGWYRYIFRRQVDGLTYPKDIGPIWDSRPAPGGTILIGHEDNIGDTIQFIRYAAMIRQRCGRVVVACRPDMVDLLRSLACVDQVVPAGQPVKFDAVIWPSDLPGIFRSDLSSIPAEVPYINPPVEKTAAWRKKLPSGVFNVGLAWSNDEVFAGKKRGSINADVFSPLSAVAGVAFHGLNSGNTSESAKIKVIDWSTGLKDYSDLAGLIASLDLVITADSDVAHLAGAMGKPVWLLLARVPDWRWLLDRADSPWYPTMRLFRQELAGEWSTVIAKISDELARLVAANSRKAGKAEEIKAPVQAKQPAGESILVADLTMKAQEYISRNMLDKAAGSYLRILEIEPNNILALNNLGVISENISRPDQAEHCYLRAVQADPNCADSHYNLGRIHIQFGRMDQAEQEFRRAIAINPEFFGAQNNLGTLCLHTGRFDEATVYYQKAMSIEPDSLQAMGNYGKVLYKLNRFGEAEELFDKILLRQPDNADIRTSRSLISLLKGDLGKGFELYDSRYELPDFQYVNSLKPRWDGRAMPGKTLLVSHEQGLGDTIQFARFLPRVRERCGRLILCCPGSLVPLLNATPGVDEIVTDAGRAKFDAATGIVSLPRIFGTTLETASDNAAYLKADPVLAEKWRKCVSHGDLNVGLVWAGDPKNRRDNQRSLAFSAFDIFADIRGVAFHSLQVGPAAGQINSGKLKIADWSAMLSDFAETAALVANLDLVIAVDTSVAHLVGSMGKPAWVLISVSPDWRWLLGRSDSPWYPSARLFRQDRHGDWSRPLADIAAELRKLLAAK